MEAIGIVAALMLMTVVCEPLRGATESRSATEAGEAALTLLEYSIGPACGSRVLPGGSVALVILIGRALVNRAVRSW